MFLRALQQLFAPTARNNTPPHTQTISLYAVVLLTEPPLFMRPAATHNTLTAHELLYITRGQKIYALHGGKI